MLAHEPLDDFRAGVFITAMFWADALSEQRWGGRSFGSLGGNDDSGHEIDLLELILLWCPIPLRTHSYASMRA